MKKAVCVLLVLLTAGPAGAKVFYVQPPADPAGAVVIDHNCVELLAIPQIHIAPAVSLRLLLRHASVGQGIGWGLDCFAGLHPTNSECSCYLPGDYPRDNWVLELRAGNWKDKVDDLVTQAETRTDEFDVFTMKFCYIDALGDSHPDWDYYRTAMEQLELDYADKVFVWWTIPLTRDGMPGTDFFNALVRSYCRANGKILFDIADIECHDPNGLKQTNAQGCEVICADYTKEIHAGHLNIPGRIRVASALWQLMASIAGWHKGSIQAAIDAASNGDTIIVADGIHTGLGNRDIDFKGKAITLRSDNGAENCIIDCEGSEMEFHRGFYFHSGEDRDSVLDGFTIINGFSFSGGGIFCEGSSPMISNNIIRNNITAYDYEGGGGISCWSGASPLIMNNIITENASADLSGGGIYCYEAGSPIIANNIIMGNYALYGGGIGCAWSVSPLIMNNIIVGNTGEYSSGGIYCWGGFTTIMNNIIVGNTAKYGGGIYCSSSSPTITNNTIVGNVANAEGGGIWCWKGSSPTMTNCIFWDNAAPKGPQVALRSNLHYGPSGLTVNYSDLAGGQAHMYIEEGCTLKWGFYNIDANPFFVEAGYWDANGTSQDANDDFWVDGDYHLKSRAGRRNASDGRWVMDEVTSPCIDAGDPMTAIGREPFPNGGRINMGAYGGTVEASKSYFGKPTCEVIVAGDINGDCAVNFLDFRLMALRWLTNGNL